MGAAPQGRRGIAVALCASVAVHAALVVFLAARGGDEPDEPDPFTVIDVDVAPPAPEGFDPAADEPAAELVEEPPPVPEADEPETTLEPEPEPVKDPEPEPEVAEVAPPADAGPPDAGPGAEVAVAADAGPTPPVVATSPGAASATKPGVTATDAATEADGPPVPTGAAADFRPYVPDGDKVTVLLRYDRLRGTPWAKLADAILAPMPDYKAIVGDRDVALGDLFESLLISSRNPTDVAATNLIARTRMSTAEVRRFLDHSLQPVKWRPVRGGALGVRQPSPLKLVRDKRVYLLPAPGMVVLTKGSHLGTTARQLPATGAAGDIDALGDDSSLPPWLIRARTVDSESGDDSGPIAVMSVGGIKRAELEIPQFGVMPTPQHFALALELTQQGFYARGTMTFDTPERARLLQERLEAARTRLLGSRLGEILLKNFHAYHALKGLTLRRRGNKVTYATSISVSDARSMMALAAEWARRFYAAQEEGTESAGGPAAPGATPAPAPTGSKPPASPGGATPGAGAPKVAPPGGVK